MYEISNTYETTGNLYNDSLYDVIKEINVIGEIIVLLLCYPKESCFLEIHTKIFAY